MQKLRISFVKKGQLLLLLSFLALIFTGTFLLSLPGVLPGGRGLSGIDALFMSTSAVCLTGLQSVPVCEFSWFGQMIILLLMQCGCIGIMSLSAGVLLMIGKGLSFSDTLMIFNLNDRFSFSGTENLVRVVIQYTFLAEAAGAVMMYAGFLWKGDGIFFSLWEAVFFAVAAFCNAGFSLYPNSLAETGKIVQSAAMAMTILGGFGVYVIYDLIGKFKEHRKLRLHSRIVLWSSALLLIAGTTLIWLLSRSMESHLALSWFDSLLLSVNARTAGFSTVDPGLLPASCQIVIIVLMLIGGAPGSAAGGVKVTTVAVICAALSSTFAGHREVILGRRTISHLIVMRSFVILVIFLLLACVGGMVLSSISPELSALSCFFESASAVTTTGMSTGGTTAAWSSACKLFLACLMFAGRIGPFTLLLFLVGREKNERIRYPEERIIVG